MNDPCPICLNPEAERNHAVEWDNGEPAPGSAEWGMSVCSTCQLGVNGEITPWEWVTSCIHTERNRVQRLEILMKKIADDVQDILDQV